MAIGALDLDLLGRYRKAKGEVRRILLNQLIVENRPLVKVLVDQLCGRGPARKNAVRLGGCEGFRDIPWDDAEQAGLMALMKAMDQFDPGKGKISYYLLLKIRYELQQIVTRELRLTRTPRGREDEAISVALVGEQRELDEAGGSEHGGPMAVEGVTPEDVAEWRRTGEWPESMQALLRARERAARAERLLSERADGMRSPPEVDFAKRCLRFCGPARIAAEPLYRAFERFTEEEHGLFVGRARLREMLADRSVRPVTVRVPWAHTPVRGFAGVSFRAASTIRAA